MLLRKHKNNTDVAICILKRFYIAEKDEWSLKIRWYNIGTKHPPIDMKIEERIRVPASAMKDWQPYTYKGESK